MSPVSEERFRHVLGHLAAGVSVVTSVGSDGRPCGLTATAVCSVSLDPPLVLASLEHGTSTGRGVRSAGFYAVNLLDREGLPLAALFARDDETKFEGVARETGVTGAPLLRRAVGYCDCRVVEAVEAGDHTVYIGRVEDARVRRRGTAPLVYHRGAYATLAPEPLREGEG